MIFYKSPSVRCGMCVSLRWSEILFVLSCYKHFAPSGAGCSDGGLGLAILNSVKSLTRVGTPFFEHKLLDSLRRSSYISPTNFFVGKYGEHQSPDTSGAGNPGY